MVEWVLPFAQRFLMYLQPEKYGQLRQDGFSILHGFRVLFVEKLPYRNVIKRCDCVSKKRFACSSLLQGSILYTTREAGAHTVFMEISRLFFGGTPGLHLANFLYMITTMARSGSTEKQTEFILDSQKIGKLPSEEHVWSLSFSMSRPENDELHLDNAWLTDFSEQISSKSKKRPAASGWPPMNWKIAPFKPYTREKRIKTQAVTTDQNSKVEMSGGVVQEDDDSILTNINDHIVIEDVGIIEPDSAVLPLFGDHVDDTCDLPESSMEAFSNSTNEDVESFCPEQGQSKSNCNDQLPSSTSSARQTARTGRQGELVAFRYFTGKAGGMTVN